jgi:hypothetical protein
VLSARLRVKDSASAASTPEQRKPAQPDGPSALGAFRHTLPPYIEYPIAKPADECLYWTGPLPDKEHHGQKDSRCR